MSGSHPISEVPRLTPLERRVIEIDVAETFLSVLERRLGKPAATDLFQLAVDQLAQSAARSCREDLPEPTLEDLWNVWRELGGDGRLDLRLDHCSKTELRFHVERCAYAEFYRSTGQQEVGVAFSCRRDEPFAKAFLPGVNVEQSTTILEGAARCEFTYTLEEA